LRSIVVVLILGWEGIAGEGPDILEVLKWTLNKNFNFF
jgi:hypothetical protein